VHNSATNEPPNELQKNDISIMKRLSHYLLPILLILAVSSLANAATLTSSVNRNQISTNETLTLTVSIDEQVDSSVLDLSTLQENFEILGTTPQSRSSFNIINGKSQKSASTTWTITLVAKNEGILTIPSFSVKSATSRPITVKVSDASSGKSSDLPLEVWVNTDTTEVYPNQQFVVEVELSASSNVRDLNGPQLVIADAQVEAFDQQSFQRKGLARQIVILKYSVFANQAGELTIPVMTFTGLQNGRRRVFGSTGTQVIARSKQLTIKVNQAPIVDGQQWFPADNVSIDSDWSGDISSLKVGEPITRTITVSAIGQQASAIPPLRLESLSDGLKSYKDQPRLDTGKSSQGFVATRIESEAIVANKAGQFEVPAVTIDWWNTKTKQWQTSTLEKQTLVVSGIAIAASDQSISAGVVNPVAISNTNDDTQPNRLWQLLSGVLLTIVLIQFYFLMRRPAAKSNTVVDENKSTSEREAWATLQASIKSDNSRAIRHSIITWGRAVLDVDHQVSLQSIAKLDKSNALSELFNALDQHLYQGKNKPDSLEIDKALKELRARVKKSNNEKPNTKLTLNPLYPN